MRDRDGVRTEFKGMRDRDGVRTEFKGVLHKGMRD